MIRICIIDSGYKKNHPQLIGINVVGEICFRRYKDEIIKISCVDDEIGHGTAITSIIYTCAPNSEFYIIKIFDNNWACDEELLIFSLKYIYDYVNCDYINISSGITISAKRNELEQLCKKFDKKNTLIISAYDNNGAVSYPASFDNVIGVDSDIQCKNRNDFIYVKNSMVNVFGYGNTQRVAWIEPLYMFVNGSSFACAHITGILANSNVQGLFEADEYLKNEAKYHIEFPKLLRSGQSFNIKKAIAFPCNKETKGLIDNRAMLPFELIDIFDIPQIGNIGKKLFSLDKDSWMTVKNINRIDWNENFDTVILGHMRDINRIIGIDKRMEIVKKCIRYNKNVFSFDSMEYDFIDEHKGKIYYPESTYLDNSFGKLFDICVPVLGIFGTSSKQGKFTLQMLLRKSFIDYGYNVGQIGTEPSSLLYGMDETFHFGFNSNFNLSSANFIIYLNHTLNYLQNRNVDIIIGGCQSNTIPYSMKNTRYLNHRQSEFLIGLNPDAAILCINPFDDMIYIERSVKFIESLTECKVISFVLFPMNIANIWNPNYRKAIDQHETENIKLRLLQKFKIPCYTLGIGSDMDALFNNIINFFSE